MLLFDWHKIYRMSRGNVGVCFDILWKVLTKELSYTSWDSLRKYDNIDFSGKSFLLNPKGLIRNYNKFKKREIIIYVALAARRNLGEYLANHTTYLPLKHAPQDKLNQILNNRLLRIENDRIYFLYEEVTMETKNGTKI